MSTSCSRDKKTYKNLTNESDDELSIESDDEYDDSTLNLTSQNLSVIPPVIALNKAPCVTALILTNNTLKSLRALKCFRNLESLQLDRNKLSHIRDLPPLHTLKTLWLNNNRLNNFRSLLCILSKQTPNLEYLSLLCNPLCPTLNKSKSIQSNEEYHRCYRLKLIRCLPNLVFLDTLPVTLHERQATHYLRMRTMSTSTTASHVHKPHNNDKKKTYEVNGKLFRLYTYYKPIKMIGSGAYSVVCSAIDQRNNKKVAIKKCKNIFDKMQYANNTLREIELLSYFTRKQCISVDIVKIYDCVAPCMDEMDSFEDICIVMPYYDTNILDIIDSEQILSHAHVQYIGYQILRGLKCIHQCGVIHGDIKPENILINSSDWKVKIIDFGASYTVQMEQRLDDTLEFICTRWYRAPEVTRNIYTQHYDEKIDIWSVGCILAEMIVKKALFPCETYTNQFETIADRMDEWSDMILETLNSRGEESAFQDSECIDLLKRLLALNPNHRLSANDALHHPYFNRYLTKDTHHDSMESKDHHSAFDVSVGSAHDQDMNTVLGLRRLIQAESHKIHEMRWKKISKEKQKKKHKTCFV